MEQNNNSRQTLPRRKCPNCGAVISDYTLTCPECGFTLESESNSSQRVEQQIDALCKKLYDAENSLTGSTNRKIEAINGFSVPVTKEALLLGFTFAKSQYSYSVNTNSLLAEAWKAKMQQFYDLLKVQPGLNDNMIQFVEDNSHFLSDKIRTPVISFPKIILYLTLIALSYICGVLLIQNYLW